MAQASPTLDEFLHRFEGAESAPGDAAAGEKVQRWVQAHPEAAVRLVSAAQAAQAAQAELESLKHEWVRQERARRMGLPAVPSEEELRRQSQAWDRLLGTSGRRRDRGTAGGTAAASAPGARGLTFEDLGARFVHAHVGKLWLGLAVVAAIVIALR